jgi:hypothetical protein
MPIVFVRKLMMFSLEHSVSFPDKLLKLLNRKHSKKKFNRSTITLGLYFSKLDEFLFMQPKKFVISQNYSEN